jgi:hypothetical protein
MSSDIEEFFWQIEQMTPDVIMLWYEKTRTE